MTDPQSSETDPAHGVHGAAREDGGAQEDPASPPAGSQDEEAWAEGTETGGNATS